MARPAGEEFTARELAASELAPQTSAAAGTPAALDANAVNARIDAAVDERLAAAIVRRYGAWIVLTDPAAIPYCVTARDPHGI